MVETQNQTTHPLQEYNDLLEKFKGWIVPLGLPLGFTYEHISHDTGFSGAQIQLNKEWSSDTSIFSKASPIISIMGNFHEPLTRYKFAAIATSLLIHQQITDEIQVNHTPAGLGAAEQGWLTGRRPAFNLKFPRGYYNR